MNRARVQESLKLFSDRAVCACIADCGLAREYLDAFAGYLAQLEENYDPLDEWSVLELEQIAEYLFLNKQWVSGAEEASLILAQAFDAIEKHRQFLIHHDLLPDHLARVPRS